MNKLEKRIDFDDRYILNYQYLQNIGMDKHVIERVKLLDELSSEYRREINNYILNTEKELSDVKKKNYTLQYGYDKLRCEKYMKSLIHPLKEKTVHTHKPGVIHLHQKNLDNLKEFREKYRKLRKILYKYLESERSDQHATAVLHSELLLVG